VDLFCKQYSIHEATRNGTKQIVLRAWFTTGHAGVGSVPAFLGE